MMNVGDLDQLLAWIKDVALMTSKYYNELKQQGFNENEAFALTAEFQRSLFNPSQPKK